MTSEQFAAMLRRLRYLAEKDDPWLKSVADELERLASLVADKQEQSR